MSDSELSTALVALAGLASAAALAALSARCPDARAEVLAVAAALRADLAACAPAAASGAAHTPAAAAAAAASDGAGAAADVASAAAASSIPRGTGIAMLTGRKFVAGVRGRCDVELSRDGSSLLLHAAKASTEVSADCRRAVPPRGWSRTRARVVSFP